MTTEGIHSFIDNVEGVNLPREEARLYRRMLVSLWSFIPVTERRKFLNDSEYKTLAAEALAMTAKGEA